MIGEVIEKASYAHHVSLIDFAASALITALDIIDPNAALREIERDIREHPYKPEKDKRPSHTHIGELFRVSRKGKVSINSQGFLNRRSVEEIRIGNMETNSIPVFDINRHVSIKASTMPAADIPIPLKAAA